MTAIDSYFIAVLREKRIVYMPTCLSIERMTKLYSHVSKIQSQIDLAKQLKGLLFLLRYFVQEVKAASNAYEESRIKFFVGDWKQDRLRAKKLLVNLQNRLAYIGDYVDPVTRRELRELGGKLGTAWERLGEILDERAGPTMIQDSCSRCRYFRSSNTVCWQQIMAKSLMTMDALDECRDSDTYLILLCYTRIKSQLLREIAQLERKYNLHDKFPADKVLCLSDDDTVTSCPHCMTMLDSMNGEMHYDTRRVTRVQGSRRITRRLPRVSNDPHFAMPRGGMLASALAAISRGSR